MLSYSLRAVLVGLMALPLAGQVTALRCGNLVDVGAGALVPNAVVLIEGNKVVKAGAGVSVPSGSTIVDLSAGTCLPGLIDVHTHLTSDPNNSGYKRLGVSVPRGALLGARNAKTTLLAGFTSARNVGAAGYADIALRDAINDGDVDGPRLLVSGPSLGITGGHCDSNLLAPEFHFSSAGVADGPWAARAKVRENVKYGADLIKICASGGVLSKGDLPGTPQNPANKGETLQCESTDGGKTWTVPHSTGVWGLPSHLLRLRDSRIVMSYGYRRAPFGNLARVSEDHGKSWSPPMIISDDGAGTDLGYPSTVELTGGDLLTIWYERMAGSDRAVLRQARWKLR